MATRNYEGKKFENEAINRIVDALTIEEALQININDKAFTVSMRTPGEEAMAKLADEFLIGNANTFGTASFYDFLYFTASSEPSVTLPLL